MTREPCMNCDAFLSLLPMTPDALPAELAGDFHVHAASCPDCAARLAEHQLLMNSLQTMDENLSVPAAFREGWRSAIAAETPAAKRSWLRAPRNWVYAASALVIVFCGTALMRGGLLFPSVMLDKQADVMSGTGSTQTMKRSAYDSPTSTPAVYGAYDANFGVFEDAEMAPEAGGAMDPVVLRSASVQLNSWQYDQDLAQINELLETARGWSEYHSVSGEPLDANPNGGRYASMTLRVPVDALDSFLDRLSTIGKLVNSVKSAEDISSSYYDVKGRLSMYEAQRDRLTELLGRAESMTDIITIEARLSEVQYTIESLVGSLNNWNSRATDAVVRISVSEISPNTVEAKASIWAQAGDAFSRSLRAAGTFFADVLIFLVMAAPYAALAAVVVGGILLIVRATKRRKAKL